MKSDRPWLTIAQSIGRRSGIYLRSRHRRPGPQSNNCMGETRMLTLPGLPV